MPSERRRGPRARIDAARVECETASGERVLGLGRDLGEGGMFIQADKLPAVGERLVLEVATSGEPASWTAVGRVIWLRDLATKEGNPRGMGVAFIDLDDAARGAIEHVLEAAATHSIEGPAPRPPSRERTVLGVGLAPTPPVVAAAPIVAVAPSRERTVLGVAPTAATRPQTERSLVADDLPAWPDEPPQPDRPASPPAVEQSVPIELTAARARTPTPVPKRAASRAPELAREPSISRPAGVPRKGRAARFVLLLLILAAAGGGYTQRASLRTWLSPYVGRALAQLPPQWFR
jgi:uncharacterized protein (TIGR02266 family)